MSRITRFLMTLLLMSGCAQLAAAQTDTARIAKIERELGPYGDSIPPSSDFVARCTALPNGRYSVWCRVQQIGLGIDDNNANVTALTQLVAGLQAQVTGLAARLAIAEGVPTSGQIIAPYVQGANIVIPTGKLILGAGCEPNLKAQLLICGQQEAIVHFESNLDGVQYQNSTKHVAEQNLSTDGGFRELQNGLITTQCFQDTDPTNGVSFTNCLKKFIDPTREYSASGTDSRGRYSWIMQEPGRAYDYTQNLVLNYYYDQKVMAFESMQSGWVFKYGTSDTPRGLQNYYAVPKQ